MILEDMQWVDTETHAAMDALVETLPPFVLVACTYRPEYADHWTGHPGFTPVRVDALEAPATDLLLDALLGTDSALAPLKRLVAERANGNPLFLQECVASLVETGAPDGATGAGACTPASSTSSSSPTRAAWPSRPSASPTTRSWARCGTARWAIAARRAPARSRAWRAGRACRSSSGPSPRSPTGPRTRPWGWTSAATCTTRWSRSPSTPAAWRCCARRPPPRRAPATRPHSPPRRAPRHPPRGP